MLKKKKVLLFEDFESIRNILIKTLEKNNIEVVIANSLNEALENLNGVSYNMVITDFDIKNNAATILIQHMRDMPLKMLKMAYAAPA